MGTFALFRKFLPRFTRCYVRYQHVDSSKLFLTEFGDPAKVVKKEEFALQLADMASKQVTFSPKDTSYMKSNGICLSFS